MLFAKKDNDFALFELQDLLDLKKDFTRPPYSGRESPSVLYTFLNILQHPKPLNYLKK